LDESIQKIGFRIDQKAQYTLVDLVGGVIPRKLSPGLLVTPQMTFADLGITSMAKIALVSRLEERFGVDVSEFGEAVADMRTVGDLIAWVAAIGVGQ
jgi:Phosphopantetheine attachment site